MRWFEIFFFGTSLVIGAASQAHADVLLFSDNFNVTPGTGSTDNANYQYDGGRQAGMAAPVQYTQSPAGDDSHHSVFTAPTGNLGQPLRLSADSTTNNTAVSPNANFARLSAIGNTTIQFDVDPNDPRNSASSSASFLALSFGGTSQNLLVDSPADHMGLLLRGTGAFRIYDGSTNVTPGGGDQPDATGGGGQFTTVTVSITDPDGNPFDGNGIATLTFSSNATGVFAFYSRADFAGNDLTFQSQSTDGKLSVSYIDNLSISAAPEPASLGLVGLLAAVILPRRRAPHSKFPFCIFFR